VKKRGQEESEEPTSILPLIQMYRFQPKKGQSVILTVESEGTTDSDGSENEPKKLGEKF
jgi:hypothetical protein